MQATEQTWIPSPSITVTLPDDSKVSGAFTMTLAGDYVSARTEGAHVNDDNLCVTFKGVDYLVHFGVKLNRVTGSWEAGDYPHATIRDCWKDASDYVRGILESAIVSAVSDVASVSPELVRAGHYAHAAQSLGTDLRELAELEEKRKEVQKRIRALRRTMANNAPEA